MTNPTKINCPICDKPDTWQKDNPSKPFCSARCKLIDLGEWAAETRKIPGRSTMASDLTIATDHGTDYLPE